MPSSRGGPVEGLAHGYINELVQSENGPVNPEADFVTVRFKGRWDFPCNEGTQTLIQIAGQERQTANSFNASIVNNGEFRFEVRQETAQRSHSALGRTHHRVEENHLMPNCRVR